MLDDLIIPFETEAYEGLAECGGLLYLKDGSLVMEFQTKDSFIGIIKSKVRKLRIPVCEIHDLRFNENLFSSKLNLLTRNLSLTEKFPGTKMGRIQLKIKRKDRENCRSLVSKVNLLVSESRLEDIENA